MRTAGAVLIDGRAYDLGDPDGFVHYEYRLPIFDCHVQPSHCLTGI
jgi:hypothetical protein